MRPLARWPAFCALLAGLVSPDTAGANPMDTFGLGSRSTAMGRAVTAEASDFSAVYYNPAGLVGARGMDFSLGYFHADPNLSMNGRETKVDSARGLIFGFVAPGEVLGVPFALGLATHLPDERLSRIRTRPQDEPRFELYDNRPQLLYLATALAVRPFSFLEVGAGISYLAATRGRLDIEGSANLADPHASQLRHEVRADLRSVRYPIAGLRILLGDGITLGLAFRDKARLKLQLDTALVGTIDAFGLQIPASYTLTSSNVGVFIPRQVTLGARIELFERRMTATLDVGYEAWSAYETSVSLSTTNLDVQLPPGLPVTIPKNPEPTRLIPPNFHDRVVPRAGVEYQLPLTETIEVPLRAGYAYEVSPVPEQRGVTNFVDTDRHVLSAGTGLRLMRPVEELPGDVRLDGHVQWSILPEKVTRKDNPADFVGDYRAGGSILALGVTLGVGFP